MPLTAAISPRGEAGFTLIELLVAMVIGVVVIGATFSILDVSLRQYARTTDRVSADRRARTAMETILLELHSSCVSAKATPVELGSTSTKLRVLSQTGAEPAFSRITLHEIALASGKLTDASYLSNVESTAPNWTFPATPTRTVTLLTGVSQSAAGTTPVFQYYKYVGGALSSTPLPAEPLSEADANETAEVTVSFTTAPETGNTAPGRTVDLANTAVLRFDPSSATSVNYPCA